MKALAILAILAIALIVAAIWAWTRSMVIRRFRVRRIWEQMQRVLLQYLGSEISRDQAVSRLARLLVANQRLPTDLEEGPEDFHDLVPPEFKGDQRIADLQGGAAELFRELWSRRSAA